MKFLKNNALYLSWTTALASMLGSLYFSNVLNFPPCVLCWYQRICMYPIVAILGLGILRKDKNVSYYVLPFSLIGLGIAAYHNLLYYKIIPESLAPCVAGVSCTTKFIEYFGFVTIPFLSFLGFLAISILMFIHLRGSKETNQTI